MEKGKPTFLKVDHAASTSEKVGAAMAINVDSAQVVRAIQELTEVVRAIKPEVRIDLPAMSPVIHPSAVPVSVTVPELPPNPPVSVTVPDFPRIPEYPVPKFPAAAVVCVCLAIIASNIAIDLIHSFFHF